MIIRHIFLKYISKITYIYAYNLSTNSPPAFDSAIFIHFWRVNFRFKVCKSVLKLARELQVRSFDSLVAHTSIVFLRYMLLSCENRLSQDDRSHGELFAALCDELEDISLKQALELLFAYLEIAAREEALTPERLKSLQESFMANLAGSIRYFQTNKTPFPIAA